MATSIKTQCNARPVGILENRKCQKVPLKDEFDIIEAKGGGVNEQVYIRIQISDLDKNKEKMLTM